MSVAKFLKVWKRGAIMSFEDAMAYKMGFFLVLVSLILGDFLVPVISVIIYSVSSGIPGWSLYEFILFQGTLILVMGIWHCFFTDILGMTIGHIEDGSFDKILLKPFPSLAFLTSYGFNPNGLAEIFSGIAIVVFAMVKLSLFTPLILAYLLLIALAGIFEYSLTIIASALAFIFVKTWRLFEFLGLIEKFSRYPLEIYSLPIKFVFTFIIPAAIASTYPAALLLGKQSLLNTIWIAIPVLLLFAFSLWLWNMAIKKYSSAGG